MFESSVDMDKKIQKQQQVYKRIKLLGTGAYGKAYLVNQIKTDQQYVIKQILMADMSQQQQQKALRQAKILEALSHPNIIRFKQVYRTSKMRLNIVMQYADEGDLATKIKQAKKQSRYFEQTQILDWFTQICLGIKHIHDRKIIHRDLKAQNIFLTSDKIIKIGDFGVSRVLDKTAMNARTVVGSPYYLSPQIIENKPYSFQTDIWSLGALLYEMCALSPPFVANNLQFLALKIVKGAYGQIPSHYSYDLKSLIKNMLNTDSSKRPNINKILTSKVISKRISSFLTESKRMDEFSHTVIHNKNIFEANLPQPQHKQQNALKPPPNLIHLQHNLENKSQICLSNINFQVQQQIKSRPFTPLIGQQRKGPNNFFNNNNKKKLIQKNLPQQVEKPSTNKNLNLNDLMQIRPSAIQQKVKLPKVNMNPTIFDRRQSEACMKKKNLGLGDLNFGQKQIPTTAFSKKRAQSKQMFENNQVVDGRKEIRKVDKQKQYDREEDLVGVVGKWKKPPKVLQKIQTPAEKIENNIKNIPQNESHVSLLQQKKQSLNQNTHHQKQQTQTKPSNLGKNINRSSSKRQISTQVNKKNVPTKKQVKGQKQKQKQKKLTNVGKKSSQKQSHQIAPVMQIVSEEMKKKAVEERQRQIIKRRSTSKSRADNKEKKKVIVKKSIAGQNIPTNNIKKPPTQNKVAKKSVTTTGTRVQQKLSQPPRLQFQNSNEFVGDQMQEQTIHDIYDDGQQIVQQEKCNSDRSQQEKMEEMYSYEEFERYEGEEGDVRDQEGDQDDDENISSEESQRLSLNLSDSHKPLGYENDNYNRMLDEMQNIKNMIAMANGLIDTLPMFGNDFTDKNVLQLSEPTQEIVREDYSDMESVLNVGRQSEVDFVKEMGQNRQNEERVDDNFEIRSNSSGSSNCQTSANLTLFSNQEHLETLKMNLEELFGEESIIFIHRFLCEVIEKEGLDFVQKNVQRMILFQNPQINSLLLKKYFRLIVTVVIMEQQENVVQ